MVNAGPDFCDSSSSSGSKQSSASRTFAMVGHRGTNHCSCHYHHCGSSPPLGGESPSPPSHSLSPSTPSPSLLWVWVWVRAPLSYAPHFSLSQFGFFRRRKHEEIKQRREELQTLNDHGVTPAGAGVDNIGDTNVEYISIGADKGGRDF